MVLQGTVSSGTNVSMANCSDNPEAPAFTEWPAEKDFGETIKGKLGDTLGDIQLIFKRTLKKLPNRQRIKAQIRKGMKRASNGDGTSPISLQSDKPIVLVLGSGWAAHSLIKVASPAGISCTITGSAALLRATAHHAGLDCGRAADCPINKIIRCSYVLLQGSISKVPGSCCTSAALLNIALQLLLCSL